MSTPEKTHEQLALETEFGQRVSVDREVESSGRTHRASQLLLEAGTLLDPLPSQPEALEFLGSCAVHIYKSPMLGQLYFASQHPLGDCREDIAAQAISALRSDVMVAYGRKRQVKRSGL
jgi:hypothetical protein